MDPNARAAGRPFRGLGTALAMALGLLVLSFSRILGDTGSQDFSAIRNIYLGRVLEQPLLETRLGLNIVLFVGSLLVLHAAFALVSWLLGRVSAVQLAHIEPSAAKWTALWSLALGAWVLVANATWFPHSSLGEPYAELARARWLGISPLAAATTAMGVAAARVLGFAAARAVRTLPMRPMHATLGATALLLVPAAAFLAANSSPARAAAHPQPHVIIIGIDSLRCDVVGPRRDGLTPAIDEFMQGGATFTDAMTPLARTFASWVTILSGRHPHSTGALVNLLPRASIDPGDTLGDMARRAGYQSFYAIDEVRFSNIDGSYGFDRTITPPMGASDFLLPFFADTPLANLFVNTRLGALLLPHVHTNRAAYKTYDPDAFVERLDREVDFARPTLLAMHLTLAHWPFSWADAPAGAANRWHGARSAQMYPEAIRRVDRQFADVMAMLERKGALHNAIVVVLSDHGEALGLPGDSVIPPAGIAGLDLAESGPVLGHGTSVLSPHQYRVVLGMRAFGNPLAGRLASRIVSAPVSLEDIAPTLADIVGLEPRTSFDGHSLAGLLQGDAAPGGAFARRVRFTETEFNPRGVLVSDPMADTSALAQAALDFRVDPRTDRVEMRPEVMDGVLRSRQFAATRGNSLLAAVPGKLTAGYHYLVVDLRGGLPRRLTGVPDRQRDPDLADLWDAMHSRFGPYLQTTPALAGR